MWLLLKLIISMVLQNTGWIFVFDTSQFLPKQPEY